jgi:transcriptional regulator with XRE-family HTH domain|tara:strand:- start:133 stop:549 length:417 start_codon:yes stop_codon:yes gene_type:complete
MAVKKKVGRKRIDLDPIKVKRLAAQGLSQKQIARSLGVSWNTLNRNRKRSKSFNEAFEQGVADGLDAVTNSLFEQALDGNTTASIFFLKNRDEARWRDRVETTHDHTLSLTNVIDSAKKRLIDITPEPKKITKLDVSE